MICISLSLSLSLFLSLSQEECDYVQKLGMTVELMNKNIFRELIFAESFMSSNLPLIIAQLRLASLSSDHYHRTTADNLSQRWVWSMDGAWLILWLKCIEDESIEGGVFVRC